jgi:hypothetical protein
MTLNADTGPSWPDLTAPGTGRAPGGGQPGGVEVGDEDALQHVPVLRMRPDTCLEKARDLLHHRSRLLLAVTFGRHRYRQLECLEPVPRV